MENNKFSSIMMEEARSARIGENLREAIRLNILFLFRSDGRFRRYEKRGGRVKAKEEPKIMLV